MLGSPYFGETTIYYHPDYGEPQNKKNSTPSLRKVPFKLEYNYGNSQNKMVSLIFGKLPFELEYSLGTAPPSNSLC